MTEHTSTDPTVDGLNWEESEGAEALDALAAEHAAKRGSRTEFLSYFKLKEPADGETKGETRAVRFITDRGRSPRYPDVQVTVSCLVHPRLPTRKPDPLLDEAGRQKLDEAGKPLFEKLPKTHTAACLEDRIFAAKSPGGCPVHDWLNVEGKPVRQSLRTFGIVVPQVEVKDGAGKFAGWADETRTVTRKTDGVETTEEVPNYQLAEFGKENFWDPAFQAALVVSRRDPTLLTRVWFITRHFRGTDTKYRFEPDDPIMVPDGNGGEKVLDLRDPEVMAALYPGAPSVREQVARLGSPEELKHLFLGKGDHAAVHAERTTVEAPSEALAVLRAQIEDISPPVPTEAPQPAQGATQAPPDTPAPTAPANGDVDPAAATRARLLARLGQSAGS